MLAFDTSSIVHAWDHYPPVQFPSLWKWIESQIAAKKFCICEVAFMELKKRLPECHVWLESAAIRCVPMTNEAMGKAAEIKSILEIVDDKYNPAGVGENDILIIASAFTEGHRLVSNENQQKDLPKKKPKYKIPLVCSQPEVDIDCIDFLTVIRESGQVFG